MVFQRSTVFVAVAALSAVAQLAAADIVNVGYFYNSGGGEIFYEGDFRDFITSQRLGDGGQYTKIDIDITGLLLSIDERAFRSIYVEDTGENSYGDAPGADFDLFRINGLNPGVDYEFAYDGPTEAHQTEAHAELFQRVDQLDWGTNGPGLPSMTFASLGFEGILTAELSETQIIDPGGHGFNPLGVGLELSEVGSIERFRVYIETVPVPAPGPAALLGVAAVIARRRRSREYATHTSR